MNARHTAVTAPQDPARRWIALLERITVVSDAAAETRLLTGLCQPHGPRTLAFVNAHAMNLAYRDPAFCEALLAADVLLRDGSGMNMLFRLLGRDGGRNMNGTDFIPRLLEAAGGCRLALWGTREPFLGAAVRALEARVPAQIVSVHDGFAASDDYLRLARETHPDLIVLGMGMPRQEQLASRLHRLGHDTLTVCGGAILDFLGGRVPRAPAWMRRTGLEWLFRLAREPRRLFARYILGNPLFLARALRCRRTLAALRH